MPKPIPAPREEGFTTTTGSPIYWAKYGRPNAPKLLILHGGPGADHRYLLPQMLHLGEKHDLLFYDQRGGGRSKADARIPITWETHVEDLGAVVEELGLDPLSIVGYSWGAMLGLLYAIEQRGNPHLRAPDRMALISPAPLTKEYRRQFEAIRSGAEMWSSRLFDCVQEREHRSPRVPDDRQRGEPELLDHRSQILDVGPPGDRNPRVGLGAAASPLVVKEQIVLLAQVEHLRQ